MKKYQCEYKSEFLGCLRPNCFRMGGNKAFIFIEDDNPFNILKALGKPSCKFYLATHLSNFLSYDSSWI
jgi:hypothetical protein